MNSRRGLDQVWQKLHPRCVACSPEHPSGLRLRFSEQDDGGVVADFACGRAFEGYPGLLHGGITSMVLDSAMANCMFAEGYEAVTAELHVRYRAPVAVDRTARVSARIQREMHPLYLVESSLVQDGSVKALATGKYMVRLD